jgi:hypothetical protein
MPPQMSSQSTHIESQPAAADRAELMNLLINEVLADYLQMRDEGIEKTITCVDKILSKWMAVKAELEQKNRDYGELFNPLRIIDPGETTHSALLGDLLNPQGSHGQDNLFLDSFLSLIGVPDPAEGKWVVTVEQGRIDILLCRLQPISVVIIENKSNDAIDQPNQLYRYWLEKIYLPYHKLVEQGSDDTKHSFKIVYLTPGSFKQPDKHSLERPEWAAKYLPERILIKPDILRFHDLMECWQKDTSGKIATTNIWLSSFLHFYSELWQPL